LLLFCCSWQLLAAARLLLLLLPLLLLLRGGSAAAFMLPAAPEGPLADFSPLREGKKKLTPDTSLPPRPACRSLPNAETACALFHLAIINPIGLCLGHAAGYEAAHPHLYVVLRNPLYPPIPFRINPPAPKFARSDSPSELPIRELSRPDLRAVASGSESSCSGSQRSRFSGSRRVCQTISML
jgi:hypothetical protein